MNTPADESTLISRLKNGSKTAFDTIYYRYVGQLMAFCQSYLHVVEDSEEVVEDVFISLWNNRNNLRNSSTLRPFLFTAAKTACSPFFEKESTQASMRNMWPRGMTVRARSLLWNMPNSSAW